MASMSTGTATTAATTTVRSSTTTTTTTGTDPKALLDSLDTFTKSRATIAKAVGQEFKANATKDAASETTSTLDPVEFLNRHYTTETLLVNQLPALRTAVHGRMESLDERISVALQKQSETAGSTRQHVQDAQQSVISLERRIRLVQEKASQSEQAVLEITKDMKRLDCAKRHLQKTITILKRLHMLVHAVEQLRLASLLKPFPDYKAASQLVDATRLLLTHFDQYTQKVQPMRLLEIKVWKLQHELRNKVARGFRIVGLGLSKTLELEGNTVPAPTGNTASNQQQQQSDPIMPPNVLSDGLLLVDSLGSEARQDFIESFCNDHLGPYQQLFLPPPPPASASGGSSGISKNSSSLKVASEQEKPPHVLEQVERRFAWYRRILREVIDSKFPNVFPIYWNFHYEMTKYFLNRTKEHLLALLDGPTKDRDASNATILLKALQKTILFEKEMMAWLQRDYSTVFLVNGNKAGAVRGDEGELLEFDETGQAVAANSAQGIRIKYERQKREQAKQQQQLKSNDAIAAAALDQGRAPSEQAPVESLLGVASSAFDNYMKPYIELEEQSMDELLVESTADPAVDTRGEMPVYTSSTKLFVYIKGSITRCTAMTKGKAFFLLFEAFQDSLRKYSLVLTGKLPQPIVPTTATVVGGINIVMGKKDQSQTLQDTSTPTSEYKIPPGDEVTVCHVVTTCEYCADTIEALEDLIRDTIESDYKEKIDMIPQQELFHDVTAKCIRVLVSGLQNRLDGAMKLMTNINWSTLAEVGEESAYVRMIHKEVVPFVAAIKPVMPSSYFRSFCDKFASGFIVKYHDTVLKLKRITEAGAQQLLLDVYNIKTLFSRIPVIEATGTSRLAKSATASSIAPAMYTKMVTKGFKKIETLLKLVSTPNALLIDVFKVQWVGGSALDLQNVMVLKGMKRTEQAAMLEKFGVDPVTALRGATAGVTGETIVKERVQQIRVASGDVAAKVNSDLSQMRQKVDDFRRAFR